MSSGDGLVLALDVGTSSTRAIVYGVDSGRPRFRVRRMHGDEGYARVDVDTVWQTVASVLDAVEAWLGHGGGAVRAAGVSLFWHSVVLGGPNGCFETPLHLWNDASPAFSHAAEHLRAVLDAEAVRQATGAPLHPSMPAVKAAALLAGRPERGGLRLMGFEDVVAERLFGAAEKSLSMATGTGLWDERRGRWHEGLLDALGLGDGALSPVCVEARETRRLGAGARGRWPRLAQALWRLPRGDGALSNVGLAAREATLGLTVGTSAALRRLGPPLPEAETLPRALFRYALDPGVEAVGGALSSGGNLVRHVERLFGGSLPDLEGRVAGMAPGQGGVTVVPHFWGERSPGWPVEARGGVVGLTGDTSAAEVVRAALDAIGAGLGAVQDGLDAMYGGGDGVLRAGGRAVTRSPALAQIVADATGRVVELVAGGEESSARGAADMALAALGRSGLPVRTARRRFVPDPSRRPVYRALARRIVACSEAALSSGRNPPL